MGRRLILLCAVVMVAAMASVAFAEVQNVKVSGDMLMYVISRANFQLRHGYYSEGYDDKSRDYFESHIRLRVDADLTDNVSATIRLINERDWGQETEDQTSSATTNHGSTEVDLDLAYVTLREFLYSPMTAIIGRQEIRYGNALIVGDPDTSNTASYKANSSAKDLSLRRAFDGIRVILDYKPWTIDVIGMKPVEGNTVLKDDTDLYGVNAHYDFDSKNALAEVYYFGKNIGKAQAISLNGYSGSTIRNKPEWVHNFGARYKVDPIENMTAQIEGVMQTGNYPGGIVGSTSQAPARREAFAIQGQAEYRMPKVKYSPSVSLTYTYLSGQKEGKNDNTYRGWDPMFYDQGYGTIINAIASPSNFTIIKLAGQCKPADDVTAVLSWSRVTMNKSFLAGANKRLDIAGTVGSWPRYTMTDKRDFGSEIDLLLTYDYTEDVQFGLNTGAFIPGKAFAKANRNTATQVIGSMKVVF